MARKSAGGALPRGRWSDHSAFNAVRCEARAKIGSGSRISGYHANCTARRRRRVILARRSSSPLSCRTSPPQGGRLDAATASANLERQRRLRARQTVAFGFLVFLTGAGGAALRPRPIAFANCEREAA
ncbi:MAG: hypothetical protein E5Y14_14370 [Mesorhizobium sp.]|nr:MAG: hypothetical protein E5Y14_14370 [Mesorhizobium sp.]